MGLEQATKKPTDVVATPDPSDGQALFTRVHAEHTPIVTSKANGGLEVTDSHLTVPPLKYPGDRTAPSAPGNLLNAPIRPELDKPDVASFRQSSRGQVDITIAKPIAQGEHVAFAMPIAHVFKPDNEWTATHPNGPEKGHLLTVSFKAKSETGSQMTAEIVGSKPPYPQWMGERIDLSAKGKPDADGFTTYSFNTVVPDTKNPGDLRFKFNLGTSQGPGQIQIKEISAAEVASLPNANPGNLSDAAENARIDQIRKADLNVRVTDEKGNPIPGATVQIAEQRSQFMFGADANQLTDANVDIPAGMKGQAAQEYRLDNALTPAQREDYLNKMEKMGINTVTIPIYWNQIEPTQGKPNYQQLDQMIDEAKAHHMQVKLHPIVWGGCYPDWAGKSEAEAEPLIHKHIDDIVKRYGNKVDFMEMNELNSTELLQHQVEGKDGTTQTVQSSNGLTDWVGHDGAPKVISTLDDWIRDDLKANHSSAKLFENEYVIDQKTLASDQQVAATASRPDALGVQMHMFEQDWPALKIEQTLNERGQNGLPDYISEITVPSGPTQGKTEAQIASGEDNQSQELRALYRDALANPNVNGVSLWDFTDKNAWRGGTGGVLDANLEPKEAYRTLQRMITDQYWTRESTGTNSSGVAAARVFKGAYQVTVTDAHGISRTVDAAVQGPSDSIDVKLPE